MIRLKHDSKHWPLALIVAQGEPCLQEHLDSLTLWDEWFSRKEPFHVLRIFLDEASLRQAKGAGQATQAWLKESAAENMRDWVLSMSIVVPEDQYGHLKKMSVRKAFGIPGGVFPTLEGAFVWLKAPPEPVDGGPVEQSVLVSVCETIKEMTHEA